MEQDGHTPPQVEAKRVWRLCFLCHFEFIFSSTGEFPSLTGDPSVVGSPREVTAQGERTVTGSQTACLSPAGVFLVAFGLWSCAVQERVVVGQALVTFSLVFSANLESTTPPTLNTSKTKKHFRHAWSWIWREQGVVERARSARLLFAMSLEEVVDNTHVMARRHHKSLPSGRHVCDCEARETHGDARGLEDVAAGMGHRLRMHTCKVSVSGWDDAPDDDLPREAKHCCS